MKLHNIHLPDDRNLTWKKETEMASRILHYIIAVKILEEHKLSRNDFILGSLLPDAYDGTLYRNSYSHFRYIINKAYL